MSKIKLSIHPETETKKRKSLSKRHNTSREGTRDGETRYSFIVNENLLETLKDIAYWERKTIKDVLDRFLSQAVYTYEADNGRVKARPRD